MPTLVARNRRLFRQERLRKLKILRNIIERNEFSDRKILNEIRDYLHCDVF